MRAKKAVAYSIVFSFGAHIAFGAYNVIAKTKIFFNLKTVKQDIVVKKPVKKRGTTYAQAFKFETPVDIQSVSTGLDKEQLKKAEMKSREEEIAEPLSARDLKTPDEVEEKYTTIEEGEKRETRENLLGSLILTDNEAAQSIDIAAISEDFKEKMPGFTPELTGGILDSIKGKVIATFGKKNVAVISRQRKFSNLKEYLLCDIATYEDPEDGQRYFRIGIRAGPNASEMDRMPKEIVFLIDCSLSIQRERLEEFKKGILFCLSHLNPDDLFNIIAFKQKMIWFRSESVKPNRAVIKDAIKFVDRLTAGETTDTYMALYESLKQPEGMIPSYLILFSDGRPTFGITNSRQIITQISQMNRGRRPIFAFSGGLRVNRYFLDFISYKNRGWTEYADRTHLIDKYLSRMYEKIKDPILLQLRYNVSGLNEDDIFPRSLPDFYRNAEFTLYGTYKDENEFSLQLLGDTHEETNEFTVIGSLSDARVGDKDIARNWAFNKIYYLIGLMEYQKDNARILEEINRLCDKFGIQTPYTEGIEE